jgi:drug/metabolite transporter (DMT)-like permease
MLGLAGIALLVGLGRDNAAAIDTFCALLVLASAGSWAIASLLSRRVSTPQSPFLAGGMNLFTGGLMLIIASLFTGELVQMDWAAVSARSVAALIYLMIGSSVITFGAYMWLLSHVSPNRLGTYAYVNPVAAVFLGWALAGETLTAQTLIAAAIIIGAVFLITTAQLKPSDTSRSARLRSRGAALKSAALRVVSGLLTL